jgi:hypothetical protein
MRADMAKVLVERPRKRYRFVPGLCGKGYKTQLRKAMASEDGSPCHEPTMRRYNHSPSKYFNEHLGPLRRFLDANVGRPWAKVYSEICRHVDRGNVVQKHILTHLFEYVVVNPQVIDGEVYRRPHERRYWFGGEPLRGPNCWYVCPKSGLLKRAKAVLRKNLRRRRWGEPPPQPERPIGWVDAERCVCRFPGGGWLLVRVARWVPVDEQMGPSRVAPSDTLLRDNDPNRVWRFYGRRVFAVEFRPLRADELEALPVTLPPKLMSPNIVR